MDHDVKTLQKICQGTQRSQNDIRAAMTKARDPAMLEVLSSQLLEYEEKLKLLERFTVNNTELKGIRNLLSEGRTKEAVEKLDEVIKDGI